MEEERIRWITRPPSLDRFEVGVRFAATPAGVVATYTASGHCDRKRGALWIYSDSCPTGPGVYDLGDHLFTLGNALGEVRPVNKDEVERALTGQYWEQGTFGGI